MSQFRRLTYKYGESRWATQRPISTGLLNKMIIAGGNMATTGRIQAIIAAAAIIAWGAQLGSAQEPPKDNKGFTVSKTTVVELGPEIEGMAGRQLRLRVLTIEPGGHIGLHSHKDRPAVVYLVQGTDTVGLADGTTKTLHPGDTSTANKDTTHWHQNDGKDNVVLIAVDIFKPPAK
jgi:quercetin dioxygenase-like cupin family protein